MKVGIIRAKPPRFAVVFLLVLGILGVGCPEKSLPQRPHEPPKKFKEPTNILKCTIRVKKGVLELWVFGKIKNTGKKPVKLSRCLLPQGGDLNHDLFAVRTVGFGVPYKGKWAPLETGPESYVSLKPGRSLKIKANLRDSYEIISGPYQVQYQLGDEVVSNIVSVSTGW